MRNGFTLLEVMICLILFSLILVPMSNVVLSGNLQSMGAQRSTTALYLAQSSLERLLNTPFSEINPQPRHNIIGHPGYSCQVAVNGELSGSVLGARPANGHSYLVKTVTVTVYYEIGSANKQAVLTMEKTNRDDEADLLER